MRSLDGAGLREYLLLSGWAPPEIVTRAVIADPYLAELFAIEPDAWISGALGHDAAVAIARHVGHHNYRFQTINIGNLDNLITWANVAEDQAGTTKIGQLLNTTSLNNTDQEALYRSGAPQSLRETAASATWADLGTVTRCADTFTDEFRARWVAGVPDGALTDQQTKTMLDGADTGWDNAPFVAVGLVGRQGLWNWAIREHPRAAAMVGLDLARTIRLLNRVGTAAHTHDRNPTVSLLRERPESAPATTGTWPRPGAWSLNWSRTTGESLRTSNRTDFLEQACIRTTRMVGRRAYLADLHANPHLTDAMRNRVRVEWHKANNTGDHRMGAELAAQLHARSIGTTPVSQTRWCDEHPPRGRPTTVPEHWGLHWAAAEGSLDDRMHRCATIGQWLFERWGHDHEAWELALNYGTPGDQTAHDLLETIAAVT